MFDLIVRIVVRKVIIASAILFFVSCLSDWGFGSGDVDLKKATWLVAEKVPLVVDKGGVPVGNGGSVPNTPVNGLFNLKPGTKVSAQALGGAIDPTGTTIVNDFDGDGILNINETTTNVWVADYPDIDTVVAPPVTMKIAILKSSTGETDEIISEINSDDIESNKNEGSESIHQNELNLRTVQFQDQYKRETEVSQDNEVEVNYKAEVKVAGSGGSVEYGAKVKNQWSARNLEEATTTKWADKPFKNDIDKEAKTVKSDSASNKARKFRSEKTSKINETSKVDANAGYVRAALYIKNRSVNMPVKLSNILCTLMFENARGDLIPVQSFRLRNDDYSLFQVEVYGGDDFGPYVVELPNLNTAEIENAIASGYTPKIFIVDYTMAHVADSNYRSVLLNFSGDNLKIVEENSKGRTSLIKVYGPNFREKYRVAAFDDLSVNNPCTTTTATTLSPGVTLKKALERISCSGVQVEFQDYVYNFSEFAPSLGESRIHIKGIKSIAGIPTNLPCEEKTFTSSDGVSRTACVQKPINSWTADERKNAGVWAIYSNGKYNALTEYWVDGTNIRIFDPSNVQKAQMVKGVDSIIWAGDYYDIVYISVKDFAKNEENPPYGTTPIGTSGNYSTIGSSPSGGSIDPNDPNSFFKLNSKWDLSQFGENPYEPDQKSFYVGQVGFGEKVVFTVKLDQTKYLNPNFGLPENGGSYQYFTDFKYTPTIATKRFNIDQVMDFEISLGFGGQRTDWIHVYKDTDDTDAYKIRKMWIDTSGYTNQTFRIALRMPQLSNIVDPENSLVNIYVRPALNSAYRKTIWPLKYTDVKKMRGELNTPANIGDTTIYLSGVYGTLEVNDSLYVEGDTYPYTVVSSTPTPGYPDGYFTVVVDTPMKKKSAKTATVSIPGSLTAPDARLIVDNSFLTDWNTQTNGTPASNYSLPQYLPLLTGSAISCSGVNLFHPYGCLGYTPDYLAVNWMGNYNKGVPYWNSWSDAGSFVSFLSGGMFQITTNSGRNYKVGTLNSDYIISDPGTAVPLGEPVSVTQGDATMIIWRRDTNLYGKVFQVSTGTVLASQFQINTTAITSPGELVAKLDNGKVTIIWENDKDIYLAIRNMTTYAQTVAETKVITRNYDMGDWSRIDVAVTSDRVMVVWSDQQASGQYHVLVRGKIYNSSTGAMTIDSFLIGDATPASSGMRFEVRADGGNGGTNVVAMTHYYNPGTGSKTVGARIYNILTGAQVGSDLGITGIASTVAGTIIAKASGTKGILVYKTSTNIWYARGLDLSNGTLVGSESLLLDSAVDDLKASLSGGYVFVTYSKSGSMYLKVLDVASGQFLYSNALQMGSVSATATQKPGATAITGNTIISVWEHYENSKRTIRGRTVSLSPFSLKGSGEFFLSTTNQGTQSGVALAVYDIKALPVWFAQDTTQQVIRGFNLDLVYPGSLQFGLNNFFIAPLIERDYTLSVQIVP